MSNYPTNWFIPHLISKKKTREQHTILCCIFHALEWYIKHFFFKGLILFVNVLFKARHYNYSHTTSNQKENSREP
jgi:hypothetical protein